MSFSSDYNLFEIMGEAQIAVEWIDCETGLFLGVNDYASVIHDMDPDKIVGKYIWELAPLLDPKKFRELVAYLRENKKSTLEIIHYNKPEDTVFPVEITMIHRDKTDKMPEHFVTFVKDISKRKKAEEALLQSNAELEEFAYRVSHDLRAPLSSSIRLADHTVKAINEGKIGVATDSLHHIKTSLARLEVLLCDILTLTKTKNEEEEDQLINVTDIINHALNNFMHMENFDRLEIIKDIDHDEPILSKKSRITLIIENLISNAIKYQDVSEETPFIKISFHKSLKGYIFEVMDNGLGIPKDQQANMFKMFKRFHAKTSFGTGLGLYMIKKSTDILNGKIEYTPHLEGSKFKVTLPAKVG